MHIFRQSSIGVAWWTRFPTAEDFLVTVPVVVNGSSEGCSGSVGSRGGGGGGRTGMHKCGDGEPVLCWRG